jgi:hypothetical protein
MPAPRGITSKRWHSVVDAAGEFLEQWAPEAACYGWTTHDIFGCDRNRPGARFDCMGLVMLLDRCTVVGLDADGATLESVTGARQRYHRRPLPAGTVSLWELAS